MAAVVHKIRQSVPVMLSFVTNITEIKTCRKTAAALHATSPPSSYHAVVESHCSIQSHILDDSPYSLLQTNHYTNTTRHDVNDAAELTIQNGTAYRTIDIRPISSNSLTTYGVQLRLACIRYVWMNVGVNNDVCTQCLRKKAFCFVRTLSIVHHIVINLIILVRWWHNYCNCMLRIHFPRHLSYATALPC